MDESTIGLPAETGRPLPSHLTVAQRTKAIEQDIELRILIKKFAPPELIEAILDDIKEVSANKKNIWQHYE